MTSTTFLFKHFFRFQMQSDGLVPIKREPEEECQESERSFAKLFDCLPLTSFATVPLWAERKRKSGSSAAKQ